MFWNKNEKPIETIDYKEKYFEIDKKYRDLQFENSKLKAELKRIKPIVESKDYKPAISKDCGDCKFCVRSPWNNDIIIGCRKDNVCADFKAIE